VDIDSLKARGIEYILLDLDNTILPWRSKDIPDASVQWIKKAAEAGMKLAIASNTRNPARLNHLSQVLGIPSVHRILKPRRGGLIRAMSLINADPRKTAIIGDQVFTDVWGGNRLGLYTVLVRPMHRREFIGTKVSRIVEWFLLRWFTRKGMLA
jgi:HAD superfamily phosphatase (TIGR01668 family)